MNPTQVNQEVSAAQANGNAQQAMLNNQSSQLQGQYGAAVNQANNAQTNATNAANAIQNGGTLYGQNLSSQEQQTGFNPQDLTQANKNLTAIQNQVAYAPTAAQQTGNYYGTTAGGTTNIYSGLMSNLNPGLTNATNSVGNLTNEYGQLTNAANQQTNASLTSEQNQASDLAGVYASAVSQMNAAGSTMASIENLQQQQGALTAQQVTAYQNAYSQYVTAQAAASQAASAALVAPTTAAANTAQAALYGSQNTAQQAENSANAAVANAKAQAQSNSEYAAMQPKVTKTATQSPGYAANSNAAFAASGGVPGSFFNGLK